MLKTFGINRLRQGIGSSGNIWVNPEPQYRLFSDGTIKYRKGIRDDYEVLDVALTATGFSGIEDTDWENVEETLIA